MAIEASRPYVRITAAVIRDLATIAGSNNVITGCTRLPDCGRDETPLASSRALPIAVKPADTRIVADILKYADKKHSPVNVPDNFLNPGKIFDC